MKFKCVNNVAFDKREIGFLKRTTKREKFSYESRFKVEKIYYAAYGASGYCTSEHMMVFTEDGSVYVKMSRFDQMFAPYMESEK